MILTVVAERLIAYLLVFKRPIIVMEMVYLAIVLLAIVFYEEVSIRNPEVNAQILALA